MSRHRAWLAPSSIVLGLVVIAACSGGSSGSGFDGSGTGNNNNNNNNGGTDGGGGLGNGDGGDANFGGNLHDGAGQTGGCQPDPSNYDIPMNNCDDDGDGMVDNPPGKCDAALAAGGDANAFAQAIGICQQAAGTKWGVVSAAYQKGYNTATGPAAGQHGILPKFGNVIKPREGLMLGVLSSGSATENDSDNGPFFKGTKSGMQGLSLTGGGPAPAGYPKATPGCPALGSVVNDMIDVKITIKVPANAKGFSFDFDFFSGEWPEYVCTPYNDSFVAFLKSAAFNNGTADNISFDTNKNPVSVNNAFFQVCTDQATTGCQGGGTKKTAACPLGTGDLQGTGFADPGTYCDQGVNNTAGGGATGWLTTQAPVQPGETITLEFMIWDTGDNAWDSSVLVDNFQWIPTPTTAGTQRPPK
jgi:hypothetical protein